MPNLMQLLAQERPNVNWILYREKEIRFVIAAMNVEEARELEDDGLLSAEQEPQFQELRGALRQYGITSLKDHYREKRSQWRPFTDPDHSIESIIEHIFELDLQDLGTYLSYETPDLALTRPGFYSEEFFSDDEEEKFQIWDDLQNLGGVLVIDAVSLFHPKVHDTVRESTLLTQNKTAVLLLTPVDFIANNRVNKILIAEFRRIGRALRRFDTHYDKLYEICSSNASLFLRRHLLSTLPQIHTMVVDDQIRRNGSLLRDELGTPEPVDIFDDGIASMGT